MLIYQVVKGCWLDDEGFVTRDRAKAIQFSSVFKANQWRFQLDHNTVRADLMDG